MRAASKLLLNTGVHAHTRKPTLKCLLKGSLAAPPPPPSGVRKPTSCSCCDYNYNYFQPLTLLIDANLSLSLI